MIPPNFFPYTFQEHFVLQFIYFTNDNIYHGVPFEVVRTIHGEENAIGTMITEEGKYSRVKIILIVGSPKEIIMPCGTCREAYTTMELRTPQYYVQTFHCLKSKNFRSQNFIPIHTKMMNYKIHPLKLLDVQFNY